MQSVIQTHINMQTIIEPVILSMPDITLRQALLDSFIQEQDALHTIENTFKQLTSQGHHCNLLKFFFQNWSKTNNSAMSVSGLANRITLTIKKYRHLLIKMNLFKVCSSLQRITDEDLGAYGAHLHSELFYRMATKICGDDSWLSKQFCSQEALNFKDWVDEQRLREKNLINGLLTTLIHEVYTHGEVEYIYPLYRDWFETHLKMSSKEARSALAWVRVHTGGTESNHFKHALNAVQLFCDTHNLQISVEFAKFIFTEYLRRKAAVMSECAKCLQG